MIYLNPPKHIREMLYQAKNKHGYWVEGLPYFRHEQGEWLITHSDGWVPSYNSPDKGEETIFESVESETISSYIGLEDIHGNKIFENMYIRFENEYFKGVGKVYYCKEKACFGLLTKNPYGINLFISETLTWYYTEDGTVCAEIIGNAYDAEMECVAGVKIGDIENFTAEYKEESS